jgi:hypothetical protein
MIEWEGTEIVISREDCRDKSDVRYDTIEDVQDFVVYIRVLEVGHSQDTNCIVLKREYIMLTERQTLRWLERC